MEKIKMKTAIKSHGNFPSIKTVRTGRNLWEQNFLGKTKNKQTNKQPRLYYRDI